MEGKQQFGGGNNETKCYEPMLHGWNPFGGSSSNNDTKLYEQTLHGWNGMHGLWNHLSDDNKKIVLPSTSGSNGSIGAVGTPAVATSKPIVAPISHILPSIFDPCDTTTSSPSSSFSLTDNNELLLMPPSCLPPPPQPQVVVATPTTTLTTAAEFHSTRFGSYRMCTAPPTSLTFNMDEEA